MKNSNKYQGFAHLISILAVPSLLIIGYFTPWIIAKIMVGILLIAIGYFIWTKVLKD